MRPGVQRTGGPPALRAPRQLALQQQELHVQQLQLEPPSTGTVRSVVESSVISSFMRCILATVRIIFKHSGGGDYRGSNAGNRPLSVDSVANERSRTDTEFFLANATA